MEGTYGQSPSGQGGTRAVPGTTKLTMDTSLYVCARKHETFCQKRREVETQVSVDTSSSLELEITKLEISPHLGIQARFAEFR